jgi:nucleoside phosphorylase
MSPNQVEFGLVAALEREVSGLVRGWRASSARIGNEERRVYFNHEGRVALVCAGTGVERAYTAAKALIENCSPRVILSIGFAGSCTPRLQPGSVVVPATVVEAATGKPFACAFGRGRLVTLDRVAGRAGKQEASKRFGALAVDMEASGVAAASAEHGREFGAIKAISDGAEEDLEFLSGFVKPEGFESGRFIAHIAFRPSLWPRVAALNRNSKLAVAALASAAGECTKDWRSFSAMHCAAATRV